MKKLEMLGFAAMAGVALMAFAGANSASADVLCKTKGDPCTSILKKGETLSSQLVANAKAQINLTFLVVECKKSTIAGKITKEGGVGVVPEANVETFSFAECGNCEVTAAKKGTIYVSHNLGTDNGMLFGKDQELITQCSLIFGKVKCSWEIVNNFLGELKGGNPAILDIVNAELLLNKEAANSAACEKEAFWNGEYEFTTPKPLYVESE